MKYAVLLGAFLAMANADEGHDMHGGNNEEGGEEKMNMEGDGDGHKMHHGSKNKGDPITSKKKRLPIGGDPNIIFEYYVKVIPPEKKKGDGSGRGSESDDDMDMDMDNDMDHGDMKDGDRKRPKADWEFHGNFYANNIPASQVPTGSQLKFQYGLYYPDEGQYDWFTLMLDYQGVGGNNNWTCMDGFGSDMQNDATNNCHANNDKSKVEQSGDNLNF